MIGTISALLLLLISFVTIAPTIFWFQEILTNIGRYILIFQGIFFISLLWVYIRKRKLKFLLLSIIFLVLCFYNCLRIVNFFYYPEHKNIDHSKSKVRVYYLNVGEDLADFNSIATQVVKNKPDILLLLEWPIEWNRHKEFISIYPHRIETKDLANSNMLILSKLEFTELKSISDWVDRPTYIVQEMKTEKGKTFNLMFWHARQPLFQKNFYPNKTYCRRLATGVRHSKEEYLVVGDFNATPFSTCYRWFSASKQLKHAYWGKGLISTWSALEPMAKLTIDHVFYNDNFILENVVRLEPVNSDHYPILFDIRI